MIFKKSFSFKGEASAYLVRTNSHAIWFPVNDVPNNIIKWILWVEQSWSTIKTLNHAFGIELIKVVKFTLCRHPEASAPPR